MKKILILFLALFLHASFLVEAVTSKPITITLSANYQEKGYSKPDKLSKEDWEKVHPFLLPLDHPVKQVLDLIHKQVRLTAEFETLVLAGFRVLRENSRGMIVAEHPKMPGYLIKTMTDDDHSARADWAMWHKRALGAQYIAQNIERNHLEKWVKVPQKWIYPIPNEKKPRSGKGIYPKQFILVVEKMDVYDHKRNKKKYHEDMNKETLKALYTVLSQEKLYDSMFIDNAGYCKDGRLAFIDTEYYHDKRPMNYTKLNRYLSPSMLKYWKELTRQK